MKIMQPFAQFRCKSLFYENMYIFATPRNKKIECWNGLDEQETADYSTIILTTSAIVIITSYIALKYSGLARKMLSADEDQSLPLKSLVNNIESNHILDRILLDHITLKNFSENHNKSETIDQTNIHLLNSIYTQKVDDNKDTCELFYKLEHEIHKESESEIHYCLFKNMDSKIVENILDSGEPGCTARYTKKLEKLLGRRWITEYQNKITKSSIIKEILGTTIGTVKILTKFVDFLKDTALSIVMLEAVGGFDSIWRFKTNFASVIVLMMSSSVLIPVFLSTLNLVVNRNKIIDVIDDEKKFSRTRKYVTITLCWVASFLNPIILDAYCHELKEDVRKMTQNYKIRAMKTLKKYKNIKSQIVTFHKTELGLKHQIFLFLTHLHILYACLLNIV